MTAQFPPGPPGIPTPDSSDETQPLILGRYRRETMLGQGGFGEVFRATDTRLRRIVAIKTLRPLFSGLQRARFLAAEARFEQEAEAASRMGVHRNIVTVYDRDRDTLGTLYLIMEYVSGGTLRDRLRPVPGTIVALPRVEALQIAADVARGLHAAHVHRVVHRDVKPANIFIAAAESQAKIGDFGIAQMDEHTIITREGSGHPYTKLYASPEQLIVTSPLGPTTDQYSLGLVLFEMLTGKAYKDLTDEERAEALRHHPPGVGALVARMTMEEPRARYESLGAVVAAIEGLGPEVRAWEAAETEPAPAPRPVPPPVTVPPMPPVRVDDAVRPIPMPRPVSRRAVLAGIGGIGGLAAAGGVGVALLRRHDDMTVGTPTAAPPAPPTAVSLAAATVAPTVAPTLAPSVAATPRIVSPTAPATVTVTGLAITPSRTLTGHTDFVFGVAFAPDGQTFASGSQDKTVRLWRVSDGTLIRTLTGHTDRVWSVAFAPDGQTLASASSDKTVRLWRVSDGTLIRTLTGHTDFVLSVAFAADRQTLASASTDKTVRLWRVSDGSLIRTLTGHTDHVTSVAFAPNGLTLASGSIDKTVRIWGVEDGRTVQTLTGHTNSVFGVAFAPNGETLASGSYDKTVRLWWVEDGTLIRTLTGLTSGVRSVAFAPDGQTLASGSDDYTIQLWQWSDGMPLQTLNGHYGYVNGLAFAPDGRILASASDDKTVRLWQLR